jgi:hypothetical protein
MIDQDQVLQIIAKEGPILPTKISKAIGIDLLFAAAVLSELVSKKKLKVSNIKIGSSPLYYKPGQESRLQSFSSHLHEKEQRAYALLKKENILRDSIQEPLIRATLRAIKDFAVPLEVTFNDQKEIFWKWYLLNNEEAEQMIKKLLSIPSPADVEKAAKEKQDAEEAEKKRQLKDAEEAEKKRLRVEEEARLKLEEERKKLEEEKRKSGEKTKLEEQQRKVEEEKKRAELKRQELSEKQRLERERFGVEEERRVIEARQRLEEERKKLEEEKKNLKKEQMLQKQRFEEEIKKFKEQKLKSEKPMSEKKPEETDPFFKSVVNFFNRSKINVIESKILKKKIEIEFLVEIESAVGNLTYNCIAKNKKRIGDSDLNSAFVQSQIKKLPTMLLVTGELTKKAAEMLQKEFKGLTVKKI